MLDIRVCGGRISKLWYLITREIRQKKSAITKKHLNNKSLLTSANSKETALAIGSDGFVGAGVASPEVTAP